MNRHTLRAFALAAALVTFAVPVVNIAQNASACSTGPTCTTTTTIPGVIDTYVSPIVISSPSTFFTERATSAQVATIHLAGSVDFTVLDPRGNNQGWVASVSSNGFASSLFPLLPIPATDITVSGLPTVVLTCYGPYGCGAGLGVASTGNLATPQPVAVECPRESIGEGSYAVTVPIDVDVTGLVAEKLGSYPASWFSTFTVSVVEGQDVSSFGTYGCPPFGP